MNGHRKSMPSDLGLRFTRVKLTNWRNFKNAEARLASRAVVVGPNASGKSNLLDAFRFLRDLVVPGGGLASAVERRGGVSRLRCLLATRNSDIEIEVDIGTDSEPAQWTYIVRFNASKNGPVQIKRELVSHRGEKIRERPNENDRKDSLLLTQTHIEQVNQTHGFRPVRDFLSTIQYLHVVPQIVRDRRRTLLGESDPYGGDFLARVKATPKRSRDALLARINKALRLAVPQFDGLEYADDEEGRPRLFAKYHHWRPHPSGQTEEQFSDGTLRLIGFLWAIGERVAGPLLLEEPELSLHDAIVEQLMPTIARMQKRSGRQVILTTHSNALLSDEGIAADEVHRLIITERGTEVELVADNARMSTLVRNGLAVGEAVMPEVRPTTIDQLSLLDLFDATTD